MTPAGIAQLLDAVHRIAERLAEPNTKDAPGSAERGDSRAS